MRPKGLIGLAVILIIVGVCIYFFTDDFVESLIEDSGSSAVGAKVEVDNLKFSIIGLSISMDRLQVTNPNDTWKNMFETGRLSFDMELAPLFRKQVIINDVTVADIRLGTKRATDGKIEIEEEPEEEPGFFGQAAESLKKQVAAAPVLNLDILKKKINVDSLMAFFDIQSVKNIESARSNAEATIGKWQEEVNNFKPKQDIQKIELQVSEIKSTDFSKVDQMVAAVDKSKKVIDSLNDMKKQVTTLKQSSTADLKTLTSPLREVDNWIKDDFEAIKAKANIGEFDARNIGKMLLGDVIMKPSLQALEYVGMARKYMPVAQQFLAAGKVEKPPRFTGQDIRFPLYHPRPDFLLEHLLISAATNQADTSKVLRLSGNVNGITSQPKIYGKPLTLDLRAAFPNSNAYSISGNLDHTKDVPEDRFEIKAAGIRFGNIALPQKPYMPASIAANSGDITANFDIIGDELDIKIGLIASPVDFNFSETNAGNDRISSMVRSVFDSIDRLYVTAGISGKGGNLDLQISSNIDDLLAQRIKGVIGETAQQARDEIRKRLDTIVTAKKQEALALINDKKSKIENEINKIEQRVNDQLAAIEQKKLELEAEIKKKKDEGVKDVKKKLKDLLK